MGSTPTTPGPAFNSGGWNLHRISEPRSISKFPRVSTFSYFMKKYISYVNYLRHQIDNFDLHWKRKKFFILKVAITTRDFRDHIPTTWKKAIRRRSFFWTLLFPGRIRLSTAAQMCAIPLNPGENPPSTPEAVNRGPNGEYTPHTLYRLLLATRSSSSFFLMA
jgi:hypothetical protein